jgi:hypothetical protein
MRGGTLDFSRQGSPPTTLDQVGWEIPASSAFFGERIKERTDR